MCVIKFYSLDINECELNTDGCDHSCSNTIGSYTCSCRDGYTLAADGRSCQGKKMHELILPLIFKLSHIANSSGYLLHIQLQNWVYTLGISAIDTFVRAQHIHVRGLSKTTKSILVKLDDQV